jgi:shikimate 5-dehydrogenase
LSVLLPPNKKSAVERRPIDNGKENTQQPKKMRQSRVAAASGWIGSALEVTTGSADPTAYVNATPLGMIKDDPLPLAVDRISPSSLVGEVVMKQEITPFLAAARQGLRLSGGHLHVVRPNPGLSRILRLRHGDI